MQKLKNLILQIPERESHEFINLLKKNGANKLLYLYIFYKDGNENYRQVIRELKTNSKNFSVLKGRLYEKLQKFLVHKKFNDRERFHIELSKLNDLLLDTPRETAIAILTIIEKELISRDMPYELATVYKLLKHLHLYTPKHYEYTQLYNRNIAFTLALDKAEDLIGLFRKKTSEHLLSGKKDIIIVLTAIINEMENIKRLYPSHRLLTCYNILKIGLNLFICDKNKTNGTLDETEIMLKETYEIINTHAQDPKYKRLKKVIQFFYFSFYQTQGLHKKAIIFHDEINFQTDKLLSNNFYCVPSLFLIEKLKKSTIDNTTHQLKKENDFLFRNYTPEIIDTVNYIYFMKYKIICTIYAKQYNESYLLFQSLLNNVSFRGKSMLYEELEMRLLHLLILLLNNKLEKARLQELSIYRKINEYKKQANVRSIENVQLLYKILHLILSDDNQQTPKLRLLVKEFNNSNKQTNQVLGYLTLNEFLVNDLAKAKAKEVL